MRASVIRADPGYRIDAFLYKVFLDGVELQHCLTADEEKGEAICYVVDKLTGLVSIEPGTDHTVTRTLYGNVEIRKE